MTSAQKARNQDYDDNDSQFQIMDFRDTIQKCIEDEEKVYGRKNKPRDQDPTMYELLSWKNDDDAAWNYTKKDKEVVDANICNKLKYKINKASSPWVTEAMDQYRKFTYSPSKKAVFFDLEDPNYRGKPSPSRGGSVPKELVEQYSKSAKKDRDIYVKEVPKKASETLDRYSIQDIKSLKDVYKVIESRALGKGGEVVKNPIAEQMIEEMERQKKQEQYESDYNDREGQDGERRGGQTSGNESEEDVHVDKMDFSNVKSRLLTKKVKKAKELDPVYEKDRLQRREERIKKLNETTRWLPNSAFKTYFGKAPFENYGRGNIKPTVGGTIYGDYLKTHNVNPHSGGNKPVYKQVFDHADFVSTRYPESHPEPPRKCKDEIRLSQKQVDDLKRRNQLIPDKFQDESKKIVKPDLVNSLRFASEENTPENSFEEEPKKAKTKNLRETLKQLNKKTRAIRQEASKNTESETAKQQKNNSEANKSKKNKNATQALLAEENQRSTKTKTETTEARQSENRKSQTLNESKQVKSKSRANDENDVPPQRGTPYKKTKDYDIAQEFDFTSGDEGQLRPATAYQTQSAQKGRSNASQGVGELMRDPPTAFQESRKEKNKRLRQQEIQNANAPKDRNNEESRSPQNKKGVSFKEAQQARSSSKVIKEAPATQSYSQEKEKHPANFGKVEGLQGLLKDTQQNEKLLAKINQDMDGTLSVNPLDPPKNYLFSLAPKETDPRYYKNVPAVWLQRIPFAGKKTAKNEDIKGVFNHSEC